MATCGSYMIVMIGNKIAPRNSPSINPTRTSRQMTRSTSLGLTSATASARTTELAAWEPALPPAPMTIGTNTLSTTTASRVDSNTSMTLIVKNAAKISTMSHTPRFLANVSTVAERYGSFNGSEPSERNASSVASASRTSIASSTVIMPRRRFSSSTTGSASKSASCMRRAAISWST